MTGSSARAAESVRACLQACVLGCDCDKSCPTVHVCCTWHTCRIQLVLDLCVSQRRTGLTTMKHLNIGQLPKAGAASADCLADNEDMDGDQENSQKHNVPTMMPVRFATPRTAKVSHARFYPKGACLLIATAQTLHALMRSCCIAAAAHASYNWNVAVILTTLTCCINCMRV